jgi:hypothetical protein
MRLESPDCAFGGCSKGEDPSYLEDSTSPLPAEFFRILLDCSIVDQELAKRSVPWIPSLFYEFFTNFLDLFYVR